MLKLRTTNKWKERDMAAFPIITNFGRIFNIGLSLFRVFLSLFILNLVFILISNIFCLLFVSLLYAIFCKLAVEMRGL